MEYKLLLTFSASIIGFIGYAPYVRDVILGRTKPHAFSWLVWGLLETIAFFAQLSVGGGIGAWVTGFSAVIALGIAASALKQKNKQIRPTDWIALSGALIGIALWKFSSNPLLAIVSIVIADALAFAPTFRKSYHRPHEETLIEYGLSTIKWALSIMALEAYSLTTWLYPASLMLTNGSFVIMSIIRKRQLKIAPSKSI